MELRLALLTPHSRCLKSKPNTRRMKENCIISDFHNALTALVCRERGVAVLVSFDQDFDQVDWLTRAGSAWGV